MSFNIEIPAKCILAGEHSILERGFALVVPFNKFKLSLNYYPDEMKTMHTISAEGNNSLGIILWPVLSKACQLLNKDPHKLTGFFQMESTIPPCSGLGFSAALCVAVAEWVIQQGYLTRANLFDFAIELENMFHKKSSGVDIAGVTSNHIIQYSFNKEVAKISPCWEPELYISGSEEKSITRLCVEKVRELKKSDPKKAKEIYEKMALAVELIKFSLESDDKETQLSYITQGLTLGNQCFYDWGLTSQALTQHIKQLETYNTLACKVIGAGVGGYVLSLWKETPPQNLPFKLHRLNL
ncbi:mevalonate kinase [Legionella busanensis]|uniref:Mevalonate kinase n=1 Tax=Legionella busanensis TaxID=190655 RepID=A0A378JHL3_9GAMM|nr:mevalonate kinase [Legionella busanensis]STX50796.1 mevalonate kinase [Legionella busanensis]